MSDFTLSITNEEIFNFYQKHNIDFDKINVLFYNILQQLLTTSHTSLQDNNLVSHLLDNITSMSKKIQTLDNNITSYKHEISQSVQTKLTDYSQDIKHMLNSNNVECVLPLLRDNNANLIDKTKCVINDLLPKNQELVNTISHTMAQTTNNFTTLMTSSENRLAHKLSQYEAKFDEIKTIFNTNHISQQTLQNSVTEILKKFEKGIGKGTISENILHNILVSMYPCARVDLVSEIKETGDILFQQNDRPQILIENKDHSASNVPTIDITKFIRDCTLQKCCGILFAQNKGITKKNNFEININNGNVLLYVQEVNYNTEIIKIAIDLVEQVKIAYDALHNTSSTTIDNAVLEEINREYNYYILQKHNMLKIIKDFTDKMNTSIGELKLPKLENFLGKHFATAAIQSSLTCTYCGKTVGKSLSQHYRHCDAKTQHDNNLLLKTKQQTSAEGIPNSSDFTIVSHQPTNNHDFFTTEPILLSDTPISSSSASSSSSSSTSVLTSLQPKQKKIKINHGIPNGKLTIS